MIHQVKASDQDVEKLRQVVELQLRLLELAANRTDPIDQTVIENHLKPFYGRRAGGIAKWIAAKRKSLLDKLNDVATYANMEEKRQFVKGFHADVELLYNPKPKQLQIAISKDSPAWQQSAGDFCRHFYALWGNEKGFPQYFFDSLNDSDYTRWDFIQSFLNENEGLYVCAICDSTAYRTHRPDGRVFTSIEHFFPKSIYPHLAIHPYNLIPICSACNSLAGDKDIMSYCSSLGVRDLVLPYQSYQNGLSKEAYIEIRLREDKDWREIHPLEIKMRPAQGTHSEKSIEIFNQIYDVENRWNQGITQIEEHVFRRIQQFLLIDVHLGNDLSDTAFVSNRLKILMALISKENMGRDPFSFVTVWYLKRFIDSIEKEKDSLGVHSTLRAWATQQVAVWEQLKEHVQELYARVPSATVN